MAIQYSVAIRNAQLDVIETVVGQSPVLRIRTGSKPADCAAADTGTVLAQFFLPQDWMLSAYNGTKDKNGTWQNPSATGVGIAGHFRIYSSDGITCQIQGDITLPNQGGDMILDNTSISIGQNVIVDLFTIAAQNA